MDMLKMLQGLDEIAAVMRRLGLRPITRFGKRILKSFMHGGLEVVIDGVRITGSIEHRGYLLALRERRKEAFMAELFKNVVRPGMIVLDIGAYLGYYALVAAQRVGVTGKVYAFEPVPLNYLLLTSNISKNGFIGRVIPVQKAVSDKSGTMPFFLHSSDPSQSSLYVSQVETMQTVVESVKLDEFLDKKVVIDVIKMDIEGAELRALKGMEQTIAHASGQLTMFVECNPSALRAAGGSAGMLVDWLKMHGFTVMIIDEQDRCLTPVGPDIESVKYVNLYCARNKGTFWKQELLGKCHSS